MDKKVLAVVVLYYPDRQVLQDNINAIINDVDNIILWENMDESDARNYRINADSKVNYINAGKNVGISKALNYAWIYARTNGYDYLLTMDQDSIWKNFGFFKKNSLSFLQNTKALIGPATQKSSLSNTKVPSFVRKQWIITSGMLVPVELLTDIGGYNENFFVDGVDIELCLRAYTKGYKSYVDQSSFLNQNYGVKNNLKFCGLKLSIQSYNPSRVHDIFFSNVVLFRIYRRYETIKELIVFLKVVILSIFFVKGDKFSKFVAVYKGIICGINFSQNKYYQFNEFK